MSDSLRLRGTTFDLAGLQVGGGFVAGHAGLALVDRTRRRPIMDLGSGQVVKAEELKNPLLARAGLGTLRYPCVQGTETTQLQAFRTALIEQEQHTLGQAVRDCHEFLASRRSGDQKLSAHPVVAYRMAGVVAANESIRRSEATKAVASSAGRAWLTTEIDRLALDLIGLGGGRSMLTGHLVQLRCTLLLLNRIYLREEE